MREVVPEKLAEVGVTNPRRQGAFALRSVTHRSSQFDELEFLVAIQGYCGLLKETRIIAVGLGANGPRMRARDNGGALVPGWIHREVAPAITPIIHGAGF